MDSGERVTKLGSMNMGEIQKWICLRASWKSYAILAFIGCIPILVAWQIGVGESTRIVKDSILYDLCDRELVMLTGFFERRNWMLYPIFLPLALFVLQRTTRIVFGYEKNSPLLRPEYSPFRDQAHKVLENGWLLIGSIIVALILVVVDAQGTIRRYTSKIEECPKEADWGWFGIAFDDISIESVIFLDVLSKIEMFFLFTMGLLVFSLIFSFNRKYLSAIYIRHRHTKEMDSLEAAKRIAFVVDMNDDDLEFGLGKMARLFNWQLILTIIIGFFMLVSRYENVHTRSIEVIESWRNFYNAVRRVVGGKELKSSEVWSGIFDPLFPDIGQILLVVIWCLLAFVVMRPANVKLLPFKLLSSSSGRATYLAQFIHPDTEWGRSLENGSKTQDDSNGRCDLINQIAGQFSKNTFWPTGNQRAKEGIFLSVCVFFLLVFPINPFSSEAGILAAITMVLFSLTVTGFYLFIQKYRLKRVHETLIAGK